MLPFQPREDLTAVVAGYRPIFRNPLVVSFFVRPPVSERQRGTLIFLMLLLLLLLPCRGAQGRESRHLGDDCLID